MLRFSCPGRCTYRLRLISQHLSPNPSRSMGESKQYTAGLIVIGDEILKGQTPDTNSHFISKYLFSWGVKVRRISVIPDDLDTIAKEVSDFSARYTYVITSGGVGPTHDDLTFEGVAKAFGDKIEPHPHLVELCSKYFGTTDLSSPKMKIAKVPSSAKLLYGEDTKTGKKTRYPLVNVRNVYLFPGVPSILEHAFPLLKSHFINPAGALHTAEMFIQKDEISITPILNEIDAKFRKQVLLGSYPDLVNSYYKVKLTLESESEDHLSAACKSLKENLPEGSIIQFEQNPVQQAVEQVYGIVQSDSQDAFTQKVRSSVSIIEESLEKYKLDEICVGFNGGKDCTALLHIVHAVVKRKFPDNKKKLKSLYIRSKLPFPEVEKFIQISRDRYKLEMLSFNGRIKDSLADLQTQHPEIKAVIMGTRKTDPYSNHLEAFSMTDSDWPQFLRVNPVLDWTYSDVWQFLRSLCLPYCSLYDRGYSSLGSMNNTHPNPSLQYLDENGVVCYKPAYQLDDQCKERDGRNK